MYERYIKRVIDFVMALCGLIILAIPMAVIAAVVKAGSPGPVFFRQKRTGRGKAEFEMLKFRTMRTDAPKDMPTHLLEDPDKWITPSGRFLRKTSLDELPQIFNILKGDMAVIGPRPALWNQYDLTAARDSYTKKGKTVNDLRPGLTGLAQVNGRDELPIAQKAAYDGEYLKNITFLYDCRIFIKTIVSVLKHDGVVEGKQG